MSFIGYFKAGINNYFNAEKKTPKVKLEAKNLIQQFRISEQYEEFEDLEEYKMMKIQINKIYNEVYNNKY